MFPAAWLGMASPRDEVTCPFRGYLEAMPRSNSSRWTRGGTSHTVQASVTKPEGAVKEEGAEAHR